jgi:hypothetical protein
MSKREHIPQADVEVENHGSVVLLRPSTPEATDWFEEHLVTAESLFWGTAIVAEPRYVHDIVVGLREDGFTVRAGGFA